MIDNLQGQTLTTELTPYRLVNRVINK